MWLIDFEQAGLLTEIETKISGLKLLSSMYWSLSHLYIIQYIQYILLCDYSTCSMYRFSFGDNIKRRIYYGYQVHIKSLTKTFLLLRNCSKTPFHKQYFQNEKVVLLFRWIFKHIPCKTWLKFASEQPFFLIVLTEM